MKLTEENYYDSPLLSQSKLKKYIQCPSIYRALYEEYTYEYPPNPAFLVGGALDVYITEGADAFYQKYDTSSKKGKNSEQPRLTPAVLRDVLRMAERINSMPVMSEFEDYETQKIFQTDTLKAKLDYYKQVKSTAYITDLKTTRDVSRFQYDFHDFGYDLQLKFYAYIAKKCNPKLRAFKFHIIVVDKTKDVKFCVYKVDLGDPKIYMREITTLINQFKKGKRLSTGVCGCPPEINCQYSLFEKSDIESL